MLHLSFIGIVASTSIVCSVALTSLHAAELKVLAGPGIAAPFEQIKAEFERSGGHKVDVRYGTTPQLIAMVTSGEPFDLVIVPREVFANEASRTRFAGGEPPEIARVGLGVAVKAGAPKPDISTPDALKRTLVEAKSVSTLLASAAGAQIAKMFDKLGIADTMKPKLVIAGSPAGIAEAVAKGEAEIAVFLTNVITAPGVDVVGPFPAELQQHVVYWAAPAANGKEADAAKALIAAVRTPEAKAIIRSKGMTAPE
jgi:molybdate transport system substrate-binding protein